MVYAGLINKNIVATLQKNGLNSIGFSGADANIIPAHKRPVKKVDFGWVGDVETDKINAQFLEKVISENICPVFCAITHDENGNLLNTNADTISSSLSVALSAHFEVNLAYCFEKNGVLENIDDENSVIAKIIPETYIQLKENNIVNDGTRTSTKRSSKHPKRRRNSTLKSFIQRKISKKIKKSGRIVTGIMKTSKPLK